LNDLPHQQASSLPTIAAKTASAHKTTQRLATESTRTDPKVKYQKVTKLVEGKQQVANAEYMQSATTKSPVSVTPASASASLITESTSTSASESAPAVVATAGPTTTIDAPQLNAYSAWLLKFQQQAPVSKLSDHKNSEKQGTSATVSRSPKDKREQKTAVEPSTARQNGRRRTPRG
jgi:hypothetical protein